MPETKIPEADRPLTSLDADRPGAGLPPSPDQTQLYQAPGSSLPGADGPVPPASTEARPVEVKLPKAPPPAPPSRTWIIIPVLLALILALFLFSIRSRRRVVTTAPPERPEVQEEAADLSNYSAFVARNQALIKSGYTEQVLDDGPFAGQAPIMAKAGGPLISAEGDPWLAALVEAFKIRVRLMKGVQEAARGNTVTRVIKGDLRGFRIQAVEKMEGGKIVAEEALLITPRNGQIRTSGRVLDSIQRTDYAGLLAEIKDAGMEFAPLSAPAGEKAVRARLRFVGRWGKAQPPDRLISGNSVGGITLGMPVTLLREKLGAANGVLKRKVRVNDRYYDVYKITDQKNDPLSYVYEKTGLVWGISIVSDSFKTDMGIGIGDSLDVIRLHYPEVRLARSETRPPYLRLAGVDGIFIIQNEGEGRVISILVGESPEFE